MQEGRERCRKNRGKERVKDGKGKIKKRRLFASFTIQITIIRKRRKKRRMKENEEE